MIIEFLLEIEDLQEICGAVGIPDWEDLSMNEHQPLRTLELSQVIGKCLLFLRFHQVD